MYIWRFSIAARFAREGQRSISVLPQTALLSIGFSKLVNHWFQTLSSPSGTVSGLFEVGLCSSKDLPPLKNNIRRGIVLWKEPKLINLKQ